MTRMKRWTNEVRMSCSAPPSLSRAGEERFPGGYSGASCREGACMVEMDDCGTAVAFFCDRHGRERAVALREPRS